MIFRFQLIRNLIIVHVLIVAMQITNAQTAKTIDSLKHLLNITKQDTTRISVYITWGEAIYLQNPDSALLLWKKAQILAENILASNPKPELIITLKKYLTTSFNDIGYIYKNQGEIPKALEYYTKSLKMREETGDKRGMAYSLNNIGGIYYNQEDIPKALEYYTKSLKIREEMDDKEGMAASLNNIGIIYDKQGDVTKALSYYSKSLKICEKIGNKHLMATSLNNIGFIYDNLANKAKSINNIKERDSLINYAMKYYNKSLEIREEIGDKNGIVNSLLNLGKLNIKQNNIISARKYGEKAYKLSKILGYPEKIEYASRFMKEIYENLGDFRKAFQYFKEEVLMHDSIVNEENFKKTQKQQARYEYEKKAATDSIANVKAMEIKNLELARSEEVKKKQRVAIYSFVTGFVIILLFSVLLFRLFIQKKRANILLARQKEEITSQRDEIEAQRDEISRQRDFVTTQKEQIEEIHKKVTDSINYARRIQEAVLPVREISRKFLGEHFILFKPKDIVSGDFYWTTRIKNWLIVTVADCTGHGVPGAFMSMLGISFLTEIVRKHEITQANQVLNELRKEIINALQQSDEKSGNILVSGQTQVISVKDGMDISLLVIDTDTNECQWAGANNPLYIVRKSESINPIAVGLKEENHELSDFGLSDFQLYELKGDKMPIAIHPVMKEFTNHRFNVEKGDCIYLFSDGFADQFGGSKGKKYKYLQLKELFISIHSKNMTEQKQIIEKSLQNWTGKLEQVDDITILGIRI